MSHIPPEKIDEVRLAADIVEVVGRRITLSRRGRDFWGLCPFHGDKSPSLKVDREKGTWHCFGCGEGGSVFNFIMRDQGLSFPEAVRDLAGHFGVALPAPRLDPEARQREERRERLLRVLALAGTFFSRQLIAPAGAAARQYLHDRRGLSETTVAAFGLGWAPADWEGLGRFLAGQQAPEELAVEAGLLVRRDQGKGSYDRFRGRVMFPIRDAAGRTVSFGGRGLGDEEPKYLNGPESPVFTKSRTLYNLDQARSFMRGKRRALVVEGYFDVITLAAGGFGETVAPLGTALTVQQVRALKGQAEDLVLVFDGDQAGMKAAARALPLFLGEGLAPRALTLPSGEDPDSFLRREGPAALEEALSRARPLTEAVLTRLIQAGDRSTPEGRSRIVAACGEVLAAIKDPVTRVGYLDQVAQALDLPAKVVAARLGLPLGEDRPMAITILSRQVCLVASEERAMLELALGHPEAARLLAAEPCLERLADPDLDAVWRALKEVLARGAAPTPDAVSQALAEAPQARLAAELAQGALSLGDRQALQQAESVIKQLRAKQDKNHRRARREAIAEAQARGDHELVALLQAGGLSPSTPPPSSTREKD